MLLFAIALLCTGGLVALLSGVWTLALAFQRHLLWGLAVLVVPIGNVAFLFAHWREARAPFLFGLGSVVLMGSAIVSMPQDSLRVPFYSVLHAFQQNQQVAKEIAHDRMQAARDEAEQQLQLISLKRQESALLERKAALTLEDGKGVQSLVSEINRYNLQLSSVLPGASARQLVAR